MRISRSRSRLTFRTGVRRRSGCGGRIVSLLLLIAAGTLTWLWYERLTNRADAPAPDADGGAFANARDAFTAGDLDAVITRGALQGRSDSADALLLTRALVYRSYADYNRDSDRLLAVQVASDALRRAPRDPDALAAHAFALQAVGQAAEAAETAASALKEAPNHTLARVALALAYARAGGYDVALRESQRAVESAGGGEHLLDALRALAISASDTGDYRAAVQAVEAAIAQHDRLLVLYFERAQYALLLGDTDNATVAYYTILVHDPGNVKARLRLCELSSLLRERAQAQRHCQEVIERAPTWADGWYRMGMEYFYQGDFEQAQRHLHRCTSLQIAQGIDPASLRFECWYIQGQAAEIRGDCARVRAIYADFQQIAQDPRVRQRWALASACAP